MPVGWRRREEEEEEEEEFFNHYKNDLERVAPALQMRVKQVGTRIG